MANSTLRDDITFFLNQLKGMETELQATRKKEPHNHPERKRNDGAAGILNYVNVMLEGMLKEHPEESFEQCNK